MRRSHIVCLPILLDYSQYPCFDWPKDQVRLESEDVAQAEQSDVIAPRHRRVGKHYREPAATTHVSHKN